MKDCRGDVIEKGDFVLFIDTDFFDRPCLTNGEVSGMCQGGIRVDPLVEESDGGVNITESQSVVIVAKGA